MTLIRPIMTALRSRFLSGPDMDPTDLVDVRRRLDGLAIVRSAVEAEVARGWALAEQLATDGRTAHSAGAESAARVASGRRGIVLERIYGLGAADEVLADAELRLVAVSRRLLAQRGANRPDADDIGAMVNEAFAEPGARGEQEALFEV
ncbi:hypothetical protein ABH935_000240 [Catenulispora sp. GAS73]|uniref:hypothetical protein n=1 Tax=Catenulispora sp. GAS73 TaxID=3156269 RepID=UPI00351964FE